MRKLLLISILVAALTACQKEIELDYRDIPPVVSIEGRVTNEGISVFIANTRSMSDSVKSKGTAGATVSIGTAGRSEQLVFDARDGRYRSATGWCGQPGETYTLTVELDGHRYQATSTMPQPAPITSAQFVWQPVLKERLRSFTFELADPEPDVRNCFWYCMERYSVDARARKHQQGSVYRWNVFEDRGSAPGVIKRDIHCMMELDPDEIADLDDDSYKSLLFEGDTILFQIMSIDRPVFEYYRSLTAGQRMGANPQSNISGGCLGYFAAAYISRIDTLFYSN